MGSPTPSNKGIKMTQKLRVPVALLLALVLVACGTLSTLQLIVDATAAAVPILQAAGVPIPASVPAYIAAVANCIGSQIGTPTPAQIAAISECMAKQIAPTLPPGIPQAVADIVALIAQDVVNYLQQNPAPVVGSTHTAHAITKLSDSDIAKLQAMRTKAQQTVVAIHALKIPTK
jgi:hypothetical protein